MTMYGASFSMVPTSSTRTTCSPVILAAGRASRPNLRRASWSSPIEGDRSLMATLVSSFTWSAATTTPVDPAPRTRPIRYLPASTSPSCTPPIPSRLSISRLIARVQAEARVPERLHVSVIGGFPKAPPAPPPRLPPPKAPPECVPGRGLRSCRRRLPPPPPNHPPPSHCRLPCPRPHC